MAPLTCMNAIHLDSGHCIDMMSKSDINRYANYSPQKQLPENITHVPRTL